MYSSFIVSFVSLIFLFFPISFESNLDLPTESITNGKYKVGDVVRSSQWENDSYWEGKIVKVVKDVVYQIELKTVRVNGSLKVYLNPSECTGKKRLSHEDGEDYLKTKIWVHEKCLD